MNAKNEIQLNNRSSRINKINKGHCLRTYQSMISIVLLVDSNKDIKMRIYYTMQLFKLMIDKLNIIQLVANDVEFTRLLNILFTKGYFIKAQIRGYILNGIKIQTINKQYIQLFNKIQKRIMKYYRAKLDAITKKVWLNDDVVRVIYSFI